LELEDIPVEETGSFTGVLFNAGTRVIRSVQNFKVSFTPQVQDEDENDDCEFDLRVTDVPLEELPIPRQTPIFKQNTLKARHPRTILFSALLLVLLAVLANTIGPVHDRIASLLPGPTATSQAQNPLSSYPGHLLDNPTNVVVEESKTAVSQVTIGGQEKYLYESAPVPYECPTEVIPGNQRQVGNFPVWLSGFGAPNTILHLPPVYLSHMKDWQGWVITFQVNVKLRYTNLIMLSINDVNHISNPLLRDPSNGMHNWRITINPAKPQHALGPSGQQYIGTWNMSLYLSGAGCYALDAAWDEGNWEMIFAAGR
jgi:hypothetical protein